MGQGIPLTPSSNSLPSIRSLGGADCSKAFLGRSDKKRPFPRNAVTCCRDGQALGLVPTYSSGIFSLSSATDECKWVLVRGISAIDIAKDPTSIESIATATTLDRRRGTGASLVGPPAQPVDQAPRPRSEAAGYNHQNPNVPSRRPFLPAG